MRLPQDFFFDIYKSLDKPLVVGRGNVLYIQGWCYHAKEKIRELTLTFDGTEYPVENFNLPRLDVFRAQYGRNDLRGRSLNSGFWRMIPVAQTEAPRTVGLGLRAVLANGEIREVEAGRAQLLPRLPEEPVAAGPSADGPLVAICMATYNPPLEFFKSQIESIQRQTCTGWVCIVNDDCSDPRTFRTISDCLGGDTRFRVFRNEANLGYYRNFERCLTRVPEGAAYVALADQDDRWHENKLETLLQAFGDDTMLAYSDMNIVDAGGRLIHDTYWTTRENNHTRLDLLLLANTVTGAASMFRRELLPDLLPFPEEIDDVYHDHFIACVALARGDIAYVDESLYDYRQHGENVIGHFVAKEAPGFLGGLFRALRTSGSREAFAAAGRRVKDLLFYYQSQYYNNYVRRILFSKVIEARCRNLAGPKEKVLKGFASTETSIGYLLYQVLKNRLRGHGGVTMHLDAILLKSVLSVRFLKRYYALRRWFVPSAPAAE